jgi:hypothetical protein
MLSKFCTSDEEMAMKRIQPKHQDTSLLLKGATIDQLRNSLLDFRDPKSRHYVGLYSPEFLTVNKLISNCFRKMKDREKRGVFALPCCYTFWFGAKPDPCLHILDDQFRSMHDCRTNRPKQAAFESVQDTKDDEEEDMMSLMTLDDIDNQEDKADEEAREELVSSMMKKYAKKCGLFDEFYGFITLPAIVCSSTGRPKSNAHVRCFWNGGPNADISPAEQREINLRTSILYLVERQVSSKDAERIVNDADQSYEMCTGKLSEMPHLSIGCTDEIWIGTWLVYEKAFGRIPYEIAYLDQNTFREEWDEYEWRFLVSKGAYEEMVSRHHQKRGIFFQYWLKYRDVELGEELVEYLRKKTTARQIIDLCIDRAFEIMKPKLNKQWREQLKPYVKIIEEKRRNVLKMRACRARKNEKK